MIALKPPTPSLISSSHAVQSYTSRLSPVGRYGLPASKLEQALDDARGLRIAVDALISALQEEVGSGQGKPKLRAVR